MEEETREQRDFTFTDKITLELLPELKRSSSFLEKETEKPVFLRELSPLVVPLGGSATFSVRAFSFPEATVQWLHHGQEITSSSTFTFRRDADEFSLVIGSVERELAGEYSCTVRNPLGQSTSTSYLYVSEPEAEGTAFTPPGKPPQFIQAIESLQLSEGGQAFFSYTVTGEPRPHIQWLRGSFHIQPHGFCVTVNRPDGSGFMNIQGVRQEHSGVYTCKACNQYGEASCSAELLVSRQEEPRLPEESTVLGSRSVQEGSEQMIYTLSGRQPQVVPTEEVRVLPDLHVFSADLHQEQLTCQTAVLESRELEERVSPLAPPHPAQVDSVKQHHMTSFVSTVQERPRIAEQHSERILSPDLLEAQVAEEQSSKLCMATCEDIRALSAVRANTLTNLADPEHSQIWTEPRPPVSCHQVDSTLSIHAETVSMAPRPEEERSFRIREGLKLFYSAQSTDHLPATAESSEPLPALEPPALPSSRREEAEPVVAAVSHSSVALSKEQVIKVQGPAQENVNPHKDFVCQSAATADERYLLQGEQTGEVPALVSTVSLQRQREGEQVLNLQVIADQEVLLSEGRFSRKSVSVLQAGTRRSPTLLHSVTQEDLHTVVCEATSEFPATTDCTSVHPKKESQQTRFVHSVNSPEVLPKEVILEVIVPDQQVAALKQEQVRRYAATSEERWPIGADHHNPLDVSVVGVECQSSVEPTPLKLLSVSCNNIQLPKEMLLTSEAKQQRALIQKQNYWNTVHAMDVSETRALEEGYALSLGSVEFSSPETKTEPKVAKRIVCLEDTAVSSESCVILQDAQQDFAVRIQEGQSVRQSLSLEEKQVIVGERSCDIQTWDRSTVDVVSQPRELLFVHESLETQTLPKELHFVIQAPKEWSLKVGPQLRAALQSAVATDREVLLADVLGRLEEAKVQEARILREAKRTTYTYQVSAPGATMEIALSFEGQYPQTADLRSELQVALHAMLACDQQSLLLEEPGDFRTDRSQSALACSEPAKEVTPPVVEVLMAVESLAGLPPSPTCHTATVRAEANASFHTVTVHSQVDVHESVQVSRTSKATADDGSSVERRETREELLVEALVTSKFSNSLLDLPVFTDSLQDLSVEQNGKAVLSASVRNASRVDWFFSGQLVESGTEFKCMRNQDTYTLVIDQVMEKHRGEFVCQAENEAGRTVTSSRLSLVSRGLMMFFCHHHLTSPDQCGAVCRPQPEPKHLLCLMSQQTHPNFFFSISSFQCHLPTSPLLPMKNLLQPSTIHPPDLCSTSLCMLPLTDSPHILSPHSFSTV